MQPRWVPEAPSHGSPEELMRLAIDVALASARNGGGPFGAVVSDADGRILALGWNEVMATHDSTAHAEVVALRRAQAAARTHRLDGHVLYASCAPCIQCYGAIYWSGVVKVYASARKEDAEAIGFDEGPPMRELWAHARSARGIELIEDFVRDERALEPLRRYQATGGVDYSHH